MRSARTEFGPFSIDVEARQLFRDGDEVHLSPKAFDLLCLLIQQRPKVVGRSELHGRIWPATHVVDANLNVLIAEIRRALGDSAQQPQYIRTVHGVGFSFCGAVARAPDDSPGADVMRCWLVASDGTFRLKEGENTVGRDPQCDVFLDTPGVSRRHASIRLDSRAGVVVLRDLGSTNGTLVRGAPVAQSTALSDGDMITVGSVELKVRLRRSDSLPETQRIRRD
jgi:DNA-binding winged helix-turn-helix (wHTH) protein